MRILHIIASVDPKLGGPIQAVKQFSSSMAKLGHSYEVATCDDPAADFVKAFPVPVHACGPSKLSIAYTPNMKPWLVKNLHNYDAVILSGIWQFNVLAGSAACKQVGKKYWVFTHGMLDPWFNKTYPLKHLKKMLFWPWVHSALHGAEAVLFTAEEERLLARESFRPYKVRERVVSYAAGRPPDDTNGQQIAAFHSRFPELKDKRFLLYLSRINPKKGCDLLLKAFNEVSSSSKDLYLVMAGPVPPEYKAELDAVELSKDAASRVVWTGMLAGDEKFGAFRACDAFILPSHQENFGIAVAEALACSKPVLISNKINIWREIESAGGGIVKNDDLEGTLELIRNWESLDLDGRAQMGKNALACYENNFTVERAAASLSEVISQK